jgi:hypothetical protein
MRKKLLLLAAVMIITAVSVLGQINPQVYYTFDLTNPLAPTVGTTNISAAGAYTTPSSGKVGKYISVNRAVNQTLTGQQVLVSNAVTVEFLWKPGDGWDENRDPILFTIGNTTAKFIWPEIWFTTTSSSVSDNFKINLQNIGPATWSYFAKNWHHLVFVYNASSGFKALYVDGTLPLGFSKSLAGGTITGASNQSIIMGSNTSFQSGQMSYDEIAVYNQAISAGQVYKDYSDAWVGNHYSFGVTAVPASPAVTAPLDILEFPLGYVLGSTNSNSVSTPALAQLKNFTRPRYPIGTTAAKNFNWMALDYMSGYYQPGMTQTMVNDTGGAMNIELAQNWNYYFLVNVNANSTNYSDTTKFEGKMVVVSNRNRQYKTSIISFWTQLRPNRYGYIANANYLQWQNCPANNFIRNSSGQFIGTNGAVSTYKFRSPASPLDSIKQDASTYRRNFSALTAVMTDTLDMINENDEVLTRFDSTALRLDPAIVTAMGAAGFGNMRQYAAYAYARMFKVLKDSVKTIAALDSTGWSMYQVDGVDGSISPIPYDRWNFSQYRANNEDPTFGQSSTFDFYPRYVWNWRRNAGAWRGIQPFVESRNVENVVFSKYSTPFVGAGWNVNEEQNMRPAQWLGLLKVIGMMGARSYYTGYFNEQSSYVPPNPPPADPKGYIWQAAMPSYAQSACDWVMDNGYNDTLMTGDVPGNYQFQTYSGYRFYSGSEEILTVVRKKHSVNQYAIATAYTNSTSMTGGTPLVDTATFTLQSKTIQLQTRRQGSVYMLDLAKDTATLIQYDDWHDRTHPQRWTTDMYVQAEHYAKYVSRAKDVRTTPYQLSASTSLNLIGTTTFLTYMDSTNYSPDTLSYAVNIPTAGTLYLWVKMRSATGTISGFSARMDNLGAFTQSNVIDTTFLWYRISLTPDTMNWTGLAVGNHTLKLIASSARTEIDQFLLTYNASTVLPEGTPGEATPCAGVIPVPTITPSAPVTQCGGTVVLQASSGNVYTWSNGQTTQSITVSVTGNYVVTVTDGAGCTATSVATVVTIKTPITALITPPTSVTCGANVTLTTVSATSYLWSTGATTQSISVSAATYTVTVTNSVGCTSTTSAVVSSATAAIGTISPSGTVNQCGGTVLLTASNNASYLWSNGATTRSITATNGTYIVTVTNAQGCTAVSAPTYVVIRTIPTASISPSGTVSACNGATTTLTSITATSYLWSTGATTQSIGVTSSSTYTVTVTNSVGCTASASTIVAYYPCVCDAPTGVYMSEIWKNGAKVVWTLDNEVTYYRVTITDQSDPTRTQTKTWRSGTVGISFSQLRIGTLYKITITPTCGTSTGSATSIYFTTKN